MLWDPADQAFLAWNERLTVRTLAEDAQVCRGAFANRALRTARRLEILGADAGEADAVVPGGCELLADATHACLVRGDLLLYFPAATSQEDIDGLSLELLRTIEEGMASGAYLSPDLPNQLGIEYVGPLGGAVDARLGLDEGKDGDPTLVATSGIVLVAVGLVGVALSATMRVKRRREVEEE
uniref:Uncharacterized protein n=1 Tax=Corethron hystrix TaxID=216773 RepID=A0A7S1C0X1_9STRA|mmetsp:Transcript_790/g.1603  ORF Transcript_790/g.1603 Transcript_790/m.1603 type:complete len:182 (+) Transcript_790:64-609(+)